MFSHKQQVNAVYVMLMHKVIHIPKSAHFVMLMQERSSYRIFFFLSLHRAFWYM